MTKSKLTAFIAIWDHFCGQALVSAQSILYTPGANNYRAAIYKRNLTNDTLFCFKFDDDYWYI